MPDRSASSSRDYSGVPEELRGLVDIVVNRLVKDILAGRLDNSVSQEQRGGDSDLARRSAPRSPRNRRRGVGAGSSVR